MVGEPLATIKMKSGRTDVVAAGMTGEKMRKIIFAALLLCVTQAYAEKIPDAVFEAKTAFLRNDGADPKDFEKFCDLLKEWGHFEYVQDRGKADIGITLSTKVEYKTVQLPSTAGGIGGVTSQQVITSYIRIYKAQDEALLWTDRTESKNPKGLVQSLKGKMKKK